MPSFTDPVVNPWADLPEGVALFMAVQSPAMADELVREAHERAQAAQAYADHLTALAVAWGSATYADAARAIGFSRQAARKRYGSSVDALVLEMDEAAKTDPTRSAAGSGCWAEVP